MIFTSEQVSCGHPDKICDQISDAILTECLRQDKGSRVAVEALIKNEHIILAGEVTTAAEADYSVIAGSVLRRIGVDNPEQYRVADLITKQSPDIAMGVDSGGAGDQGMMFGYATNETPELLPIPFVLATWALKLLRDYKHPLLKPDAKAQVSYDYSKKRIDTFLISTQHDEKISRAELERTVKHIMNKTAELWDMNTDFTALINPTGRFVVGGSFADSGVTGRKIIADTYGGMARHGGGAFSGKDPTKVDRSGAYICRKIARDIIGNGWASKCEIQISYAIGVPQPVSVWIDCFGTNRIGRSDILAYVKEFDLTPKGVIDYLDLLNVDYNLVSAYGHFGNSELPWERM